MKKVFKIIGWGLLILLMAAAIAWFGFLKPEPPPISSEDRAEIKLMPLPAELKLGKAVFLVDETMDHDLTGLSTPRLERAVERFYKKSSLQTGMKLGEGREKTLILECGGSEKPYPAMGDDESYSISVSAKKIVVKAAGETGILYALESLLQLTRQEEGAWVIPTLSMNDQPRYAWRGLMIDACIHWVPMETFIPRKRSAKCLSMLQTGASG